MFTSGYVNTETVYVSSLHSTQSYIVYICCGSILSLVQIFFLMFLGIVMYDYEFETKENKI